MKILTKFVFAMIIFLMSCSTNQDAPKEWSLSGNERLIDEKTKEISLRPMGNKPIKIPPNSFPWLPKDKKVVVHTALESYYNFPEPIEFMIDFLEKDHGLLVITSLDLENKVFPHNPKERTWIALDIDGMVSDDAIHFFEVRPNKNDNLVGGKFDFLWRPNEDFLLNAGLRANQIEIYVSKLEISENESLPHVNEPWLSMAKSCAPQRCIVNMYVWLPEIKSFNKIELTGRYSDRAGEQQQIPILVFVEKSRINP